MTIFLGIDTGGTFTDFVLVDSGILKTHKVLSTPHAPEQAILQGIKELELGGRVAADQFYIVHGSTVATNAVLEGKGVSTAFITNHGLRDMLSIGRQTRQELYNLHPVPVVPPVPRDHCLETGGRLSAQGEVVDELTTDQLNALVSQVVALKPQAVAINLLFSYLDDRFEKAIAKAIKTALADDIFISRSSAILPEFKEYERGITTWLNAYVGPLVQGYLGRLQQGISQASISVMQSSGGTIAAQQAGEQAVHMLLSGPAGGLAAARFMGDLVEQPRLLTFDMGGTSTDVAMIDGELQLTNEGHIAHYPVAVPMVDMHTIGAGGGSIASVDAGGLLQVGPESAGASPGPACYAKGGKHATVTDANLLLGRLRADAFLGGDMQLDEAAARTAIDTIARALQLSVEETAMGIIRIANEHMAQALRVMSVQRGIDARELTLVSFGGAGGLHVCALAEALGMHKVLVPVHAGVLSALGMLVAPRARQLSRTITGCLHDFDVDYLASQFAQLIEQGTVALQAEGVRQKQLQIRCSLDLRYQGQSYYLNVLWEEIEGSAQRFHELHTQRYGHQLDLPVELVNVRVALSSEAAPLQISREEPLQAAQPAALASLYGIKPTVAIYVRDELQTGQTVMGPALITETVSTTFVELHWRAQMHSSGGLLLTREG